MPALIGLISDAHGNAPAFDKGVELLLDKGAEHIYFLGDAIGYVPSISVLSSIKNLGNKISCVQGNHEAMLLAGEINSDRDSIYQLEATRAILSSEQMRMIELWPQSLRLNITGLDVLLVHGSPDNPTFGYTYPDTDPSTYASNADWIFMANTHRPFIRKELDRHYVNIGSCAMPRDDGRFGSVALFDSLFKKVDIFRFDITQECHEIMMGYPSINQSVRDLYNRRSQSILGDFLW